MIRTGIEELDRSLDDSRGWVREIHEDLGLPHPFRAYAALRSVLQATRDSIPFEKTIELTAGLPAVIRGATLEGWKPVDRPVGVTREEFLALVARNLADTPDLDPEAAVRSVFDLLARRGLPIDEPWTPLEENPHARAERMRLEIEAALAAARSEGIPVLDRRGVRAARPPRAPRGDVFDKPLHKVMVWIKDLRLKRVVTRQGAFRALVAVLRALRVRLTRDEALHLGSQLPMILRGFVFEGWRPDAAPVRERRKEEFLARVEVGLKGAAGMGTEIAARAVFGMLGRRVTEGELEDIRQMLPEPVRELWPTERAPSRGTTLGGKAPPDTASRGAGPTPRSRAKKARRRLRSAIARARAGGVPTRDLPLPLSHKSPRKSRRGNPW